MKGKPAWNRGLKTPEHVKSKMSSSISKAMTGKKLSMEARKSISLARIRYLENHPDKVPYRLYHSSHESYPEKLVKTELEKRKIMGWKYRYQFSIYEYDFAFIKQKIDIEIDGGTHLSDKVRKIDERRDEYSRLRGWKVLRIPASEVLKDVGGAVDKIVEFVAQW